MKLVGVGGWRENSNTKHLIKIVLERLKKKLLLYFDRIIFIKIHIHEQSCVSGLCFESY